MRIESFRLENFRGLESIEFEPDRRANVFAGPNAIGKTTILEGIRLLKALLFPRFYAETQLALQSLSALSPNMPLGMTNLDFGALAGDAGRPIRFSARILLTADEIQALMAHKQQIAYDLVRSNLGRADDQAQLAFIQFLSSQKGNQEFQYRLQDVDSYLSKLSTTPTISLALTIDPDGRSSGDNQLGQLALSGLERQLLPARSLMSYFPADRAFPPGDVNIQFGAADANIHIQSHLAQPATKYNRLKQTIINDLLLGTVGSTQATVSAEFSLIFKDLLPGKEFANVRVSPVGLLKVNIRDQATGRIFDIDSMSSGEKGLILTFLLIRYSISTGGILLIDEPELHLNPAVCQRILPFLIDNFLNKDDLQAFVCTHSPEIVAAAFERDDCNLFHLRSGKDITRVYHNDFSETFEALRRLGASTADVLNSRGSIFVEGDHDVEILQVGFYDRVSGYKIGKLGGRGEIEREFKTLLKAEQQNKLNKVQCFILDLDNRPKPSSMQSSRYVRCLQWDRYCLENFLVDQKILFEVVSEYATRKPESRGSFDSLLRAKALEQMTGTIVKEVYAGMEPENPGLRKEDLLGGTFKDAAKILAGRLASIKSTLSSLNPDDWQVHFVELCMSREEELKAHWDKNWIQVCNGKELLMSLYPTFQINLDPLSFKKKVVEKMRVEGRDGWSHLDTVLRDALREQ